MMIKLVLDAQEVETKADELLIDLLLRKEFKIPDQNGLHLLRCRL
jgi:hypothetical protein